MKLKNQISNFFGSTVLALGVTESPLFRRVRDRYATLSAGGPAGADTAGELIFRVLQILFLISGSLAVLFLVIGGIQYVLSRGNEEATEKAKKTITAAVMGLAIVIMASAIVFIVANALITGEEGVITQ